MTGGAKIGGFCRRRHELFEGDRYLVRWEQEEDDSVSSVSSATSATSCSNSCLNRRPERKQRLEGDGEFQMTNVKFQMDYGRRPAVG